MAHRRSLGYARDDKKERVVEKERALPTEMTVANEQND
jgi:hypothetical protein